VDKSHKLEYKKETCSLSCPSFTWLNWVESTINPPGEDSTSTAPLHFNPLLSVTNPKPNFTLPSISHNIKLHPKCMLACTHQPVETSSYIPTLLEISKCEWFLKQVYICTRELWIVGNSNTTPGPKLWPHGPTDERILIKTHQL
jgi:hypothetical protein